MRRGLGYWRDRRGTSALEFALVVPVFLVLVMASINLCLLLYANGTLHYTVDSAARCMSVRTTVCTSPGATQTWALNHYQGPGVNPTFTATAASTCYGTTAGIDTGSKVTGTATFKINGVIFQIPVTMTATSCYPT